VTTLFDFLLQDDDSDLEFELEAVPALNPEELAEAKECAKVIAINILARTLLICYMAI